MDTSGDHVATAHPLVGVVKYTAVPVRLVFVAGILCSLIGAMAIAGGLFHIPLLMRVEPSFSPMVLNVAIALMLDGIALLFVISGRGWGAWAGSVFSLLVGVLTILEFALSENFGIDELLSRGSISGGMYPGRPAPNAAVSLIICGVALGCAANSRWREKSAPLIGVLGAMVSASGGAAVIGYLTGMPMFIWGDLKPMAAPGGVSFTILGFGIAALAWQADQSPQPAQAAGSEQTGRKFAHEWLALAVGCAVVTMLLVLASTVARELHSQTEQAILAGIGLHPDTPHGVALLADSLYRSRITTVLLSVSVLAGGFSYLLVKLALLDRRRRWAVELAKSTLEQEMHRRECAQVEVLRLASIVRYSDDAIIGVDLTGLITTWNPGAERLFEYTAEQIVGRPVALLVAPGYQDEMPAVLDRLQSGERVEHYEAMRCRKDGELVEVSLTLSPMFDAAGKLVGVSRIARDIKERRLAERSVAEAHGRTLAILEGISDGFNALDHQWRFTYVNPAAARMMKLSTEQMLGKVIWDLFPAADRSDFGIGFRRAVKENTVVRVECYYPSPLNAWFEVRCYPSKEGLTLFFTDTSEQRRSREVAEASRWQLSQLLQLSLDVVGETDIENLLRRVADGARTITGASVCVAQLRNTELITSTDGTATPDVLLASFRFTGEQVESSPFCQGGVLGTRLIDRDGCPNGMLMVSGKDHGEFTDVDEIGLNQLSAIASLALRHIEARTDAEQHSKSLRESEDRLQQLNATLERRIEERTAELSNSNRELEAFSYSVSHDLRAPLRSVEGFAKMLLRDYQGQKLDDQAIDYMDRMCKASRHMGQLIADLLSLSKITRDDLNLRAVDLSELAASVMAELKSGDPDRSVTVEVQPGMVANTDRRMIRVALDNLLGNAWKFTSKTPSAHIEFGSTMEAGRTIYFVRDNGAGFDMGYSQQLFTPFQRLHRADEFEGTGIGLATVQRIVTRNRGRVWAVAAPGEGATIYFTLGET